MYFIIIAIIVGLDQLAKYLIQANFALNSSVPLIDGIFHITYIQNSGAAFSLFQNKTGFLIAMQLIVITIVFGYLVMRRKKEHWCMLLSLSLIIAGGLGNLIDRAMYGYVIDFLDMRFWPIFNVADISVCVGCGLLVLYMFLFEPKFQRNRKTENTDGAAEKIDGSEE